jgi:hypothetical protein
MIALVALVPGIGAAQSFTPSQALDHYLESSPDQHAECAGRAFSVQIDASLPKLQKHGSMSGLKLVSETGQIVYRGLRFTGDKIIKTDVIARFLTRDAALEEQAPGDGVNRSNYTFEFDKVADYNGLSAFVFHLKPKRKKPGMFNGELWLDANTADPLRLWGDFVKSPSIFISSFRFVRDYQGTSQCFQPARLLVTADTRVAGPMEMAVWLHSLAGQTTPADLEPSGSR